LKIIKTGNKYAIKQVTNNCFQLVKILKEFDTLEEAQKALFELLEKEKPLK
jgi:hypothetical protein